MTGSLLHRLLGLAASLCAVTAQRGSAGYVPAVNAGDRALAEHRYGSAAYSYRYALEWDPHGVAAHVGLGNVYLHTGKRERALDEFQAALRVNAHSSEAERGLHEARSEGQEAQAFDELGKRAEAEPKNADVQTTYAEALIDRFRFDEAQKFADKALALDPHQWHAYCALGRIAAHRGDVPAAKKDLGLAVAHDREDDDAIETLGNLEMQAKNYSIAVEWFRSLARILPEEREGHAKLAEALDAAGDHAGAEAERAIVKRLEGQESGGAPSRALTFAPVGQTPPPAAPAAAPDEAGGKPPVSGGAPTITDAAEMSAPGWLEFDPGVLKDLVQDQNAGTPFTFKYTTQNKRLQYLLASDGLLSEGGRVKGLGDTYPGVHYLLRTQEHSGWDLALKGILKVPTAPTSAGGTGKFDYSGFLLASRDFTKWGFHGDFNIGEAGIGNASTSGYSAQSLLAASTTSPIRGGRWQYTNELVYFSGIPGDRTRVTTMHGFAYCAHSFEVYSAAIQVRLVGDIAQYQLLLAASFNIAKM